MLYRVILFCFLSLLTCGFARAGSGGFSFRYADGLIWVDVRSGASGKTLHFLLDSGAGSTIIDSDCARRLNLDLGRSETVQSVVGRTKAWRVRNLDLTLNGHPLPGSALVVDLRAFERTLGKRIDGLIGIDFFEKRAVQLNYRSGRARIFERCAIPSGAIVVPLRSRNSILCAKLDLNDVRSQWMRVDTGCSEALHWSGNPARRAGSDRNTTVALKRGSVSFRDVTVQWEGRELATVRAGLHTRPFFKGEDGLLGNGLLSHFCVTIDARNRRLILE